MLSFLNLIILAWFYKRISLDIHSVVSCCLQLTEISWTTNLSIEETEEIFFKINNLYITKGELCDLCKFV